MPRQPPPAALAPLLAIIAPQLATRRDLPPAGDQWLHEVKFDGYRTMAYVEAGRVRLITRNGLDWTGYYGHLAGAFQDLRCRQAILDGEVVVQDAAGVTGVPALEQALKSRRTEQLIFYAFDLLHLDGNDLRARPLLERKGPGQAPGHIRFQLAIADQRLHHRQRPGYFQRSLPLGPRRHRLQAR
jgi:ATP-dependent DNA ligase